MGPIERELRRYQSLSGADALASYGARVVLRGAIQRLGVSCVGGADGCFRCAIHYSLGPDVLSEAREAAEALEL